MDTEIMVEALPILGVCNLCLNEGAVKSMLVPHINMGKSEIYSKMLLNCFSIDISQTELGDTKRLICFLCIDKLRECETFRTMVQQSLNTLKENVKLLKEEKLANIKKEFGHIGVEDNDFDDIIHKDDDLDENEEEKVANIKEEVGNIGVEDNDFDDIIHKDDENEPKLKIKKEPPESIQKRRTRKLIKLTTKKSDMNEIEKMLSSGLFPFRIRKNKLYACCICHEKTTSFEEIKDHTLGHSKQLLHIAFRKMIFSKAQRFYKVSTFLRCKVCTKDVKDYEELKEHTDNCARLKYSSSKKWNNLPFKLEKDQLDCPICKKTFLNYVNLNTHMNVHYPDYICENCGKAFASKARLRGHMRTHEVGSFPCRYCEAVFDRVTKRENHVSKEHKAGVRYACKRCNISLTSFYARQKHLAEVHNEELKRYKCKACPQSYITPGHLSSHVRRDHLNERNHKCDKCDLAFYTKNALKMHMIKHDGERIHTCHVCQKSYQRKKTLREHLRIHDNDKRFVCPVCGRAFTQKCTLKGHMKVHERKIDLDVKRKVEDVIHYDVYAVRL